MKIIDIFIDKSKENEAKHKIEEKSTLVTSAQTDLTCALNDLNCEMDRLRARKKVEHGRSASMGKS